MICLWKPAFPALALLCAASVLFARDVKTSYNHNANFSQVHTYSWGDISTTDPLYVEPIKDQVDRDLQARGWILLSSGGNAIVFAKGNVHSRHELETFYGGRGDGWGGSWGWRGWAGDGFGEATPDAIDQPPGLLVVDIFEGASQNLMWRGISAEDLSNSSGTNTRNLNKDIHSMFRNFPRK